MFGEINPKMIGKFNHATQLMSSLTLTGNTPSNNYTTDALDVTGAINLNISGSSSTTIGNSSSTLAVNAPSNFSRVATFTLGGSVPVIINGTGISATPGLALQLNGVTNYTIAVLNAINGFYIQNGANIFLQQNSSSALSLLSANNTLDDGSGNQTINGQINITKNGPLLLSGISTSTTNNNEVAIELSNSNSVSPNGVILRWDSSGGIQIQDTNFNTWLTQGGLTTGNIQTTHNTLDNGSGGCSFATSGSAAVNIGTGSYTGTIAVGNSSSTTTVLGTTTINNTGASSINIGTGSYTGQITIGSGSTANAVNINSNGNVVANFITNSNTPSIQIKSASILRCAFGYNTVNGVHLTNGNGVNILSQSSGSSSDTSLITANNTLDDGSGTITAGFQIFSKGYSVAKMDHGFYLNDGTGPGGANYLSITGDALGSMVVTNRVSSAVTLQINGSTNAVSTIHNTLDDGSGNVTLVGTSDPTLRLRRSSYSSSFTSKIRFSDDNTSGKYWELGTDVNGNKGGDLYFYGQGAGGLGLAMQLTAKGYLYLGYTGPWFQTTVTTPSTGNQTITAAQLLAGIVTTPITSSAFTWTTDTGTNIYSAMGSPSTGTTFTVLFSNNNNSAGAVMTIAFGSGVTGDLRIDTLNNNQSMVIYFRCTGTNTFTCYS